MAGTNRSIRWIACLPSVLSSLRIVLAVGFVFLPAWRLGAVLGAAATDLVDGYLARRFRVTSWQGGLLDAIADKLFTLTVLAVLTVNELLWPWQVLVLLLRDITVSLLAAYIAIIGEWQSFKKMPSRFFGRATTAAMFAVFLGALCFEDHWLAIAIFALGAALSISASLDYVLLFARGLRGLRGRERAVQQSSEA